MWNHTLTINGGQLFFTKVQLRRKIYVMNIALLYFQHGYGPFLSLDGMKLCALASYFCINAMQG